MLKYLYKQRLLLNEVVKKGYLVCLLKNHFFNNNFNRKYLIQREMLKYIYYKAINSKLI